MLEKCPHCGVGKLVKYTISDSRDCTCVGGCRRGWIIDEDGNYHEVFAGTRVYSPDGQELDVPHISMIKKGGDE